MNLSNVDLNLLKAFDALMEEQHVTRAAQRVGLSQPAMSNALSRLRDLFSDDLLVRTPRGMEPTPRALELHGPIRDALRRIQATLDAGAPFDPATAQRTFTLAMSDLGVYSLMPTLIEHTVVEAPGIDFRIRTGVASETFAGLEEGAIDLALGWFPKFPSGLRYEVAGFMRAVVIARQDHPELVNGLTLERYLSLKHVVVSLREGVSGPFDNVHERLGLKRRVILSQPHVLVAPFVVAQTDCVALLSEPLARQFSGPLCLNIFDVPFEVPPIEIGYLRHRRYDNDPAHRWMTDTLKAGVSSLPLLQREPVPAQAAQ